MNPVRRFLFWLLNNIDFAMILCMIALVLSVIGMLLGVLLGMLLSAHSVSF